MTPIQSSAVFKGIVITFDRNLLKPYDEVDLGTAKVTHLPSGRSFLLDIARSTRCDNKIEGGFQFMSCNPEGIAEFEEEVGEGLSKFDLTKEDIIDGVDVEFFLGGEGKAEFVMAQLHVELNSEEFIFNATPEGDTNSNEYFVVRAEATVDESKLFDEDKYVAGDYVFKFDGVDPERDLIATIALDAFHDTVPVSCLEEFEFTVFHEGEIMEEATVTCDQFDGSSMANIIHQPKF